MVILFSILLISSAKLIADDSYQQKREQLMALIEIAIANNSDFFAQ
jgi:hypothetical protein